MTNTGENEVSLIASFEHEDQLLAAAQALKAEGCRIVESYTPYPVKGLPAVLDLGPTRLPGVCLVLGLVGALAALLFQTWATSADWPLNVGGKPSAAFPVFLPVTFEVAALLAALGTIVVFFARTGLRPGRAPSALSAGSTDHCFVLVVAAPASDGEAIRDRIAQEGAVRIGEAEDP